VGRPGAIYLSARVVCPLPYSNIRGRKRRGGEGEEEGKERGGEKRNPPHGPCRRAAHRRAFMTAPLPTISHISISMPLEEKEEGGRGKKEEGVTWSHSARCGMDLLPLPFTL